MRNKYLSVLCDQLISTPTYTTKDIKIGTQVKHVACGLHGLTNFLISNLIKFSVVHFHSRMLLTL